MNQSRWVGPDGIIAFLRKKASERD
jgi:hypothetical protein